MKERPIGFERWLRADQPPAKVTAVRVGGYPQVMLEWRAHGKVIDVQCFTRRGTGLSQADWDFFFYLGATVRLAPKKRWMI